MQIERDWLTRMTVDQMQARASILVGRMDESVKPKLGILLQKQLEEILVELEHRGVSPTGELSLNSITYCRGG